MTPLLFFYFAGVIVVTSFLVIGLKNPIYSAISLLVMFFHVAGLYVLLNAEFIAVIQIIVYAGAILVLYLFVVMLLNVKREERYQHQFLLGLFVGLLILTEVLLILMRSTFSTETGEYTVERINTLGSTQAVGQVLYTTYLFPFEVASFILLVAMIGAIVLAKKGILEK
ncbi:MAG: NADH-quinone oxidoreductase subunit J [Nitrospira sp.]|nr:NADH-quinone oxidoreductase subunit J [Nitrospira sp.]